MLSSMARPLTLDDVARLAEGDEVRYELVDGNLITVPPANIRHQRIMFDLAVWLSGHGYGDRVILTPGVRTSRDNDLNGRIPDLVVTSGPIDGATVWIDPALVTLAVEIVSTGSQRTDRWFKPIEYARVGIPWYWRVEPDDEILVPSKLVDGRYVEQHGVQLSELLAGDVPPF